MYAADTGSATSNHPFSAKSTLQALLKSREKVSIQRKQLLSEVENSLEKFYSTNADNLEDGSAENPSLVPAPVNGDNNRDFSYSQKLFHIADGNLYSIFSPIQGRSYGMKPSFLRKQKCTVQESNGKGRRVLRKGLKFHNFLPSESVTSEKDGGRGLQDQWRVHSECKLREEHGTKQIMVSNWFQNVRQSDDDSARTDTAAGEDSPQPSASETANSSSEMQSNIPSPCPVLPKLEPLEVPSLNLPFEPLTRTKQQAVSVNDINSSKPQTGKHKFLDNLLQSVSNCQATSSSGEKPLKSRHQSEFSSQKHRRKPNQTRRVVPYTKYLSILEETESHPLDLSMNNKKQLPEDEESSNQQMNILNVPVNNLNFDVSTNASTSKREKYAPLPKLIPISFNPSDYFVPQTLQLPQYMCNVPLSENMSLMQQVHKPKHESRTTPNKEQNTHSMLHFKLKNLRGKSKQSISSMSSHHDRGATNHSQSSSSYTSPSEMPSSSSSGALKPRRRSQRSVIKQKLEDTFRQNGFLVKTKQVSDGEATFCKFRQLRKYTRYYLKSWQQHLPDEVHKMWKGFLPPKTVLPPSTGSAQNSVDENM